MTTTQTTASTSTSPSPAAEPARWVLDASHSTIGFSVRHLMITNVRGQFSKVSGEVVFDPRRPEASRLTASVETASIDTREPQRDAHLRSADFFDSEAYPLMTYVARSVSRKGDGYEIVGDLTIRETSREVVLTVEDVTPEQLDPYGNRRIGAHAEGKIRRSEFGMKWNAALEAGGVVVGDEVKLSIDVSLVKQA